MFSYDTLCHEVGFSKKWFTPNKQIKLIVVMITVVSYKYLKTYQMFGSLKPTIIFLKLIENKRLKCNLICLIPNQQNMTARLDISTFNTLLHYKNTFIQWLRRVFWYHEHHLLTWYRENSNKHWLKIKKIVKSCNQ